jgi:hypothetical protein
MKKEKFEPIEVAQRLYPEVYDRMTLGYVARLHFCENEDDVFTVVQYFHDNERDIAVEHGW